LAISLRELSGHLGAQVHGDPSLQVHGIGTLHDAKPGEVSFFANPRYRRQLQTTRASVVILAADALSLCPVAALVVDHPYLGFARAAALFAPPKELPVGIHGTAWVSPEAVVHESACIGPQASVSARARIGRRALVGPGCVIGEDVVIGDDTRLVARVTLCQGVRLGERGLLHPGVVIGADGFGIANDAGVWVKVPQLGSVRIDDDVEIGANTTVDRGAIEDTVVEQGVKIDNQVQIGHNVHIGAHTAIAGCVAIAGSVRIGKRCAIGGAASIAGHLEIADDVYLTAASEVAKSISRQGIYSSGMPVQENQLWRKNIARFRHLDDLARRIKRLEDHCGVTQDQD
jgi:UDP-3-O-[3-hydroxymyristoyl] glucosamine N-acyltransferase